MKDKGSIKRSINSTNKSDFNVVRDNTCFTVGPRHTFVSGSASSSISIHSDQDEHVNLLATEQFSEEIPKVKNELKTVILNVKKL